MKNIKKALSVLVFVLLAAVMTIGQIPSGLNYQAVARNSDGDLLANTSVQVKFTVLKGATNVFTETYTLTTNDYGLFNVVVGQGSVTFTNIDWGSDAHKLKVELKVGSGSFINLGENLILPVPYAEFARRSGTSYWSKNGSDIFYNPGKVGVGLSTPLAKMHVKTNGGIPGLRVNGLTGWEPSIGIDNGSQEWRIGVWSDEALIFTKLSGTTFTPFRIYNNSFHDALVIGENGLGIGAAVPQARLDLRSEWSEMARFQSTAGSKWLAFYNDSGQREGILWSVNGSMRLRSDASDIRFITDGDNGNNTRMYIAPGGNVGIGTEDPSYYRLRIDHGGYGLDLRNGDEDWELYSSANGSFYLYHNNSYRGNFNETTGDYACVSDRRLKTNFANLENVLEDVKKLRPLRYQFKDSNPGQSPSIGFVAQDVEPVFPELVRVTNDERLQGIYSLNYSGFGVIAIAAIQEQQKQIEVLQEKVKEIDELKAEIEALKAMMEK